MDNSCLEVRLSIGIRISLFIYTTYAWAKEVRRFSNMYGIGRMGVAASLTREPLHLVLYGYV